ncbi:MAG: hypothetical protein FWC40_04825 [Proteobacteria bacterium]|nr:hypothetical protein [Pseudomonadota bacterium]
MKKAVLVIVGLVVVGAFFAWSALQRQDSEAAQFSAQLMFPGMLVETLDTRAGSSLVAVFPPVPQDASPDALVGELYRISGDSQAVLVDDGVYSARHVGDDDIVYVSHKNLQRMQWRQGGYEKRTLATGIESDFALSPDAKSIVVSRHAYNEGFDAMHMALIDLEGRVLLPELASGQGMMHWPHFSPDGRALVFIATFSGLASWYVVRLDDKNIGQRQLTNVGVRVGMGSLPEEFIPVPSRGDALWFVDNHTIHFDAGDSLWQLDIHSGNAFMLEEKQ